MRSIDHVGRALARPRAWAAASPALLLAACSIGPTVDPDTTRDASPPHVGDASSPSDAGQARDVESGASHEAGPTYATPYFPLAVGLAWTWKGCGDGGFVTSRVATETEDGGPPTFTETDPPGCTWPDLQYALVAGDGGGPNVEVNAGTGWYLQYVFPPALNLTWAAGGLSGATYTWDEQYESYTVPAGTFSDCWRRSYAYGSEIYCRDVGMVEASFSNGNFALVGKNF